MKKSVQNIIFVLFLVTLLGSSPVLCKDTKQDEQSSDYYTDGEYEMDAVEKCYHELDQLECDEACEKEIMDVCYPEHGNFTEALISSNKDCQTLVDFENDEEWLLEFFDYFLEEDDEGEFIDYIEDGEFFDLDGEMNESEYEELMDELENWASEQELDTEEIEDLIEEVLEYDGEFDSEYYDGEFDSEYEEEYHSEEVDEMVDEIIDELSEEEIKKVQSKIDKYSQAEVSCMKSCAGLLTNVQAKAVMEMEAKCFQQIADDYLQINDGENENDNGDNSAQQLLISAVLLVSTILAIL